MNTLNFRYLGVFVLLLAFLPAGKPADASSPLEEGDGKLVVLVTWGDSFKTPAPDAYVEARGFVSRYGARMSFVLNSPREGRYEASLPPGVYDVFVSDTISVPACKHMLIKAGSTTSWSAQLELDQVFSEK